MPIAFAHGASEEFFVDTYYDFFNRDRLSAELVLESSRARFYLEDEYLEGVSAQERSRINSAIGRLAQEFDGTIYPKTTELFGSIWNPGIDDDPRVTILFSRFINGVVGYFNPIDEVLKETDSSSNEREMIYLAIDYLFIDNLKSYVAHEFQHLISHNQKERTHKKLEDIWTNELRSEYIATYLGYDAENYEGSNLKLRVEKFIGYPSDSLTEWSSKTYDYSPINLLAQYMADNYGNEFFRELIKSPNTGMFSFADALRVLGYDKDFDEIFTDWMVAVYINEFNKPGIYSYKNPLLANLKVDPTAKYIISGPTTIQRNGLIKEWSPLWYEIEPTESTDNKIKINFSGETNRGEFKAKILKLDSSGNYYVANWNFSDGKSGEIEIRHLGGGLKKVIIMPYLAYVGAYYDEVLDYQTFDLSIESETEIEPVPQVLVIAQGDEAINGAINMNIKNGELVRAKGDYRVYVIQNDYKRHIKSGRIFDFYGHLNWENIKEISRTELAQFKESSLIRAVGDERVYEVDLNGGKHWLNISGDQFVSSGRDWESVYVVNDYERDFYQLGSKITS